MGWFLSLILIFIFYGITAATLWVSNIKDLLCSLSKKEVVSIFTLSVGFIAIVMAIMARERYVYFWDFGSYWYKTLEFQNGFSSAFADVLNSLLFSIENDEYNNLACAIIALPLKAFGNSYFAFVILNTALFYVPTAFLLAFTLYKVTNRYSLYNISFTWIYAYTLLFSIALYPILLGYVDIIGMIPLATAYLLVIDREFERIEPAKDLLLGASALLLVLLRRYYAYAAVGGGVFALFFWMTYGATWKNPFYRIKAKVLDTLTAISIPVIMLFVFFKNFLLNSLLNNHLSAYSAYKSTNLAGEWMKFAQYFGLLFVCLMLIGIIYNIRGPASKLTAGILLGFLTGCTLFFRIQDMGAQHYYIAVLPACFFVFWGIQALLFAFHKEQFIRLLANVILLFIVVGNFLMSMGFGTTYRNVLWQNWMFTPRIRYDIKPLNDLERCLERLCNDGYHGVYCVASSGTLNSDILAKLNAPDRNFNISYTGEAHIDLRDGFDLNFFEADIIIVCSPIQIHLSHGQEVITKLNEVMLTDNIFSDNYEERDSFILDGDVRATIFVKIEPLDVEDIEYIETIYEGIYPDYPELFSQRINNYLTEKY